MREVKIILKRGTYFVSYVSRVKHGRYHAAQFDSKYSTVEQVEDWISRKGLKLVSSLVHDHKGVKTEPERKRFTRPLKKLSTVEEQRLAALRKKVAKVGDTKLTKAKFADLDNLSIREYSQDTFGRMILNKGTRSPS